MDLNNYYHQISVLESRVDYLETELCYLNKLLMECGFPEGIETLKLSAEELIREKMFEETP